MCASWLKHNKTMREFITNNYSPLMFIAIPLIAFGAAFVAIKIIKAALTAVLKIPQKIIAKTKNAHKKIVRNIKGIKGEKTVRNQLNQLDERYTVFNDVLISTDMGTTQIDHIVVSKYGVFVIETKNYTGILTGKEYDKKWLLYIKTFKKYIDNPLRQNLVHLKALMEVLNTRDRFSFHSVLCVSETCNVIAEANAFITQSSHLFDVFENTKFIRLTDAQVARYCARIRELNITDKKARKEHLNYAKTFQKCSAHNG